MLDIIDRHLVGRGGRFRSLAVQLAPGEPAGRLLLRLLGGRLRALDGDRGSGKITPRAGFILRADLQGMAARGRRIPDVAQRHHFCLESGLATELTTAPSMLNSTMLTPSRLLA